MMIKNTSIFSFCLLSAVLVCLLLTGATCFGADEPIQIEADGMTSLEKTRTVVFTGNVDAKQGTVRIRSDKMTVFYSESKPGSSKKSKNSQQVEKITCVGNVEITSEEWLGTSDTMHYFSKKSLVQLIGNAKAYKGQNTVKGPHINHYLDTGKSEVIGGTKVDIGGEASQEKESSRVNMTILEQ